MNDAKAIHQKWKDREAFREAARAIDVVEGVVVEIEIQDVATATDAFVTHEQPGSDRR